MPGLMRVRVYLFIFLLSDKFKGNSKQHQRISSFNLCEVEEAGAEMHIGHCVQVLGQVWTKLNYKTCYRAGIHIGIVSNPAPYRNVTAGQIKLSMLYCSRGVNENFLRLFCSNSTLERCNCDVNLSKDGKLQIDLLNPFQLRQNARGCIWGKRSEQSFIVITSLRLRE